MERELENLRNEINCVDDQLFDLLEQRFILSEDIGLYKKENNLPILDARREEEIINKIKKDYHESDHLDSLLKILDLILNESKNKQK